MISIATGSMLPVTRTVTVADALPAVAVIVAVPLPTAVSRPPVVTEATVGAFDAQLIV